MAHRDEWDLVAQASPEHRRAAISPAVDYEASGFDHAATVLGQVEGNAQNLVCVDFGCGDGRVAVPLSLAFGHVIGVDSSPAMLEALLDRGRPNIAAVLYEGPWDEPAADVVYSMSVFIHNTYDEGRAMLADIATMLVPGGLALLQIPVYGARREPAGYTDVGTWTRADLEHAADGAGLYLEAVYANPGVFAYDAIGPYHSSLHRLRRQR